MIVISDSAPITYLAKIGSLSILKNLYSTIFIPSEVWNELMSPILLKNRDIPSDIKFEIEAKEAGWLIVKDPENDKYLEIALNLSRDLGRGESYAIALSLELSADLLLINDKKAKETAEELGINTKWITEILLEAVEKNFIKNFQEFKEIFESMIENGLWIEREHYKNIFTKAKEFLKE